jgi:tetraacyldisaccharide 4'-kinase
MSSRSWLTPLVPLYRFGLALRGRGFDSGRRPVWGLERPVVSIGNLSTGGAGKTPLTIALAQALTAKGWYVDVLSRGYGRRSKLPARVRVDGGAEEFGDEPLLIAREAGVPVYVAADRFEAGVEAESEGEPGRPAVHLLDDGFQHRQLYRDVDILLLNRRDWSDQLLPAGNLREELNAALRADVIAVPGEDADFAAGLQHWLDQRGWDGRVWKLRRRMDVPRVDGAVVAFCGIAHPEQFFAGLEAAGVRLAERIAFRDHHRYAARDLERLRSARQRANAVLMTTAKDAVRFQPIAGDLLFHVAPLRTEIEDEDAAVDWLIERLHKCANQPV